LETSSKTDEKSEIVIPKFCWLDKSRACNFWCYAWTPEGCKILLLLERVASQLRERR